MALTFSGVMSEEDDDLDDGLSYVTSRGPVDITEENLEDLLAYDDLFLDYFNAFLALPVFPTPLYYNRLTGTFLEVDGGGIPDILGLSKPATPPYGATDEERECMLQWAKEERLPLFLRTQLFREFKLNKLLLRPLDDRNSGGRGGSSKIRGYSRMSDSYVSSLSNSMDNSANDADFDDYGQSMWEPTYRKSALYRYPRPGSRAFSLPSRVGLGYYGTRSLSNSAKKHDVAFMERSPSVVKSSHSVTPIKLMEKTQGEFTSPSRQKTDATIDLNQMHKSLQDPGMTSSREVTFTTRNTQNYPPTSAGSRSAKTRSARSNSGKKFRSGTPKPKRGESTEDKENMLPAEEVIEDYDYVFGEVEPTPPAQKLVEFNEDRVSEAQTEKDVEHLEGKHKMPIQFMKEQVLGSVYGMTHFKDFLHNTFGENLVNFWLDCEFYKDTMEEYDEDECTAFRNRLFRDIQDKYKLALTTEAKKQIATAARDSGLSHTVFIRTQYDILRRLRTYWLPRFLIHRERSDELKKKEKEMLDLRPPVFSGEQYLYSRQTTTFFPSISLASSMPVKAEDLMQIAKSRSWDLVSKGGKQIDVRVKSAKPHLIRRRKEPTLKERLLMALSADKEAGGPLRSYLERHREQHQSLCNLLFWQDVTEYGAAEDRSADRMLRMVHAWNIYNTYLCEDSRFSIGINREERDEVHSHLLQCRDLVGQDVFVKAKNHSVQLLEKSWIKYLKEDMKTYIDAHLHSTEVAPSTMEEYEVVLDKTDNQLNLYVRGPRPWIKRYPPSTASERAGRLHTALSVAESIDTAKLMERKRKAKERREKMEKERKKAMKEARKIMRERNKKPVSPRKKEGTEDGEDSKSQAQTQTDGKTYSQSDQRLRDEGEEAEKVPTFLDSVKKNKNIIPMFKKFIADTESKESRDMLNMYMEIDTYQHMEKEKGKQTNKDKQATLIFKTYIDQSSKKKIQLSDKVYTKMKSEKERPKTPTLRECQNHVLPVLEEAFGKFWHAQQEIYGDGKNMTQLSKAELAMRSEDLSLMTGWKSKGGGKPHRGGREKDLSKSDLNLNESSHMRRRKPDGRAQPTREDQVDFLSQLGTASAGHLPIQMLYFYKYLVKYGEDEAAIMSGLDRDLFFYFEVQKFKDCSHQYSDDELLKRKAQSLLDCYLESATPPAVQVNIQTEIANKTIRAANKYLQGKEVSSTIFDEAQFQVFRNLLPYWAGFQRSYKPPSDEKKAPMTKPQRDRKKRLDEIKAWKTPSASTVSLPALPKGASVAAFTFSVSDGVKWRDQQDASFENLDGLGLDSDGGAFSQLGSRKVSMIKVKRTSTMDSENSKRSVAAK